MKHLRGVAVAAAVLIAGVTIAGGAAQAQKQGGTLRVYHRDSPGNMSILEEGTISIVAPIMGVFNNLVVFDPNVKQNSLKSIVPDLAESWSWNEDGTELTFKLRGGVKWHDGQPFTAADVKCTMDLVQGKAKEKLRVNAREAWWLNLKEVTTRGRSSGDVSPEAAAAGVYRVAGLRFHSDLSVPRVAGRYAPSPDRHRPVQICRIQAQPVDQDRAEPGLLEARTALPRRGRMDDHPRSLDRDARLCRRANST